MLLSTNNYLFIVSSLQLLKIWINLGSQGLNLINHQINHPQFLFNVKIERLHKLLDQVQIKDFIFLIKSFIFVKLHHSSLYNNIIIASKVNIRQPDYKIQSPDEIDAFVTRIAFISVQLRLSWLGDKQYIINNMEISHILSSRGGKGRTDLLSSIIEPDLPHNKSQNQFIIKKVPLAQKVLIQDYRTRATLIHPNIPTLILDFKSKFYLTVQVEKIEPFLVKDLLMIPFQKRAFLLLDILKAIDYLARHYGFFYISQKMLGYNQSGNLTVWIHEEVLENRRKCPINHGKLSEEIFVADFKECFGGNFRDLKQFYHAKTMSSLRRLLEHGERIYQSVHISEPITKRSLILRQNYQGTTLTTSNNWQDRNIVQHQQSKSQQQKRKMKHSYSLSSLMKREISMSYMAVQESQIIYQQPKKITRTLSSPFNIRLSSTHQQQSTPDLRLSSTTHYEQITPTTFNLRLSSTTNYQPPLLSPKSFSSKTIISSPSCNNLAHTNISKPTLPKIHFSYSSSKQGWKKKDKDQEINKTYPLEPILSKCTSATDLRHTSREPLHEPLKVSFPHTTTHTFIPFASNGNISLNFNESINFSKKGINFVKEEHIDNACDQHISQESNQVEMDLDCLFSESGDELHSQDLDNMSVIMEEFESILLA